MECLRAQKGEEGHFEEVIMLVSKLEKVVSWLLSKSRTSIILRREGRRGDGGGEVKFTGRESKLLVGWSKWSDPRDFIFYLLWNLHFIFYRFIYDPSPR